MTGLDKPTKITVLTLLLIFGLILFWNIIRGYIIAKIVAENQPIAAVTTTRAVLGTWHPFIYAVGTVAAINGVSISSQAAGNVVQINFESGQNIKKDTLLVQIDDRQEQAQLQNNIAAMNLAQITFERNKALLAQSAVPRQTYDQSCSQYQQAAAAVAQTQALIAYKHVTAPFDGKLGIRQINLGQYVRPGDNIVSLQSMNPLYVNFFLPEQYLAQLVVGQTITLKVDPAPNRSFQGKINAINSLVDVATHNVAVQATVPNNDGKLFPGLFARVNVVLPLKKKVVLIPQTAINYTLYGNTVFVLQRQKDKDGKALLTIALREVETGEQRNNQIIVTKGLKSGEEIVTSGQLKLSNGQTVTINNTIQP
jgi:membrane fusion protein (multidrug efflux system)